MDRPTYTYNGNEIKQFFDKQARDRSIVKRDSSLIQCLSSKKAVASYAQSNDLSEDLVMKVWSKQVRV